MVILQRSCSIPTVSGLSPKVLFYSHGEWSFSKGPVLFPWWVVFLLRSCSIPMVNGPFPEILVCTDNVYVHVPVRDRFRREALREDISHHQAWLASRSARHSARASLSSSQGHRSPRVSTVHITVTFYNSCYILVFYPVTFFRHFSPEQWKLSLFCIMCWFICKNV